MTGKDLHPRWIHEVQTNHRTVREKEGETVYFWCRSCDWTHSEEAKPELVANKANQ